MQHPPSYWIPYHVMHAWIHWIGTVRECSRNSLYSAAPYLIRRSHPCRALSPIEGSWINRPWFRLSVQDWNYIDTYIKNEMHWPLTKVTAPDSTLPHVYPVRFSELGDIQNSRYFPKFGRRCEAWFQRLEHTAYIYWENLKRYTNLYQLAFGVIWLLETRIARSNEFILKWYIEHQRSFKGGVTSGKWRFKHKCRIQAKHFHPTKYMDDLVQVRRNSIANVLELRLSCTKSSR